MLQNNVFVTGGAGFLGRGIIARAHREGWPCAFTVFSRDPIKHQALKREYPHVRCILGDVRDYERLALAMAGHETVIHAAAMKHIPEAEANPSLTYEINVDGSRNVAMAAIETGVLDVVGISTDKVCHPVNVYGATKFLLERAFQEANNAGPTRFHLVRYGNVVGSTGSVITEWRRMAREQGYVTATDPDMTRFWLTVDQAVDLILASLGEPPGTVLIPRLPAASMRDLREWFLPDAEFRYAGLRPGEKMHEELSTVEEMPRLTASSILTLKRLDGGFQVSNRSYTLWPNAQRSETRTPILYDDDQGYVSNQPDHQLTRDEFAAMVGLE